MTPLGSVDLPRQPLSVEPLAFEVTLPDSDSRERVEVVGFRAPKNAAFFAVKGRLPLGPVAGGEAWRGRGRRLGRGLGRGKVEIGPSYGDVFFFSAQTRTCISCVICVSMILI